MATRDSDLISNGRLARYVLGSYSARKLGLRSTGNAGWRVIRPPHLPLSQEQGDKVWAAWTAAGAIPLPGLAPAKAAAE